jgi:translation elongation factor P/translation initiation factor 5A
MRVDKVVHSKQARSGAVITLDAEEMGGSKKSFSKKYRSNDTLEVVDVENTNVKYKGQDEDDYDLLIFENEENEEYKVSRSMLTDIDSRFINETDLGKIEITLRLDSETNEPFDAWVITQTITCTVVDSPDVSRKVASDRASPITKKVVLDDGASVTVPGHVDTGDKILIKLKDGSYMGKGDDE